MGGEVGPWQCVRAFHTNNRVASAVDRQRFLYQGSPWQCVRAFHTNNRGVSAVDRQRFLYTRWPLAMRACVPHKQQGRPTTISLHKAVPGNACVRSTQITGSSLQSTDNDFSPQGGPVICVECTYA